MPPQCLTLTICGSAPHTFTGVRHRPHCRQGVHSRDRVCERLQVQASASRATGAQGTQVSWEKHGRASQVQDLSVDIGGRLMFGEHLLILLGYLVWRKVSCSQSVACAKPVEWTKSCTGSWTACLCYVVLVSLRIYIYIYMNVYMHLLYMPMPGIACH